jgi:hypothetical protein
MTKVSARFHQLSKTKLGLSPTPFALMLSGALPASAGARGAVARLRSVPGRAKGTHERGSCWWCSHPEAEINRPRPPLPYVANICRVDFEKVDRDVIYVASVLEACCKRLFKMFYLFQTYVASVFYLDAAHVSHLCCESMFEMFQLFQSYVAISVISGCCVCFIHLFQLYVPNVSSASIVCCIQVFHVSEVESHGGHGLGAPGWGAASRGPAVGARSAPRIMRMGALMLTLRSRQR